MHSMCMFQQVTNKKSNKLHLLDPIPLNTCSLVNVASVLREICTEVGIVRYGGDKQHWTVVSVDGLPYSLMLRLKEESFICQTYGCEERIFGHKEFNKYHSKYHENKQQLFAFEFDWYL